MGLFISSDECFGFDNEFLFRFSIGNVGPKLKRFWPLKDDLSSLNTTVNGKAFFDGAN
jgi:hypothetical protein